MAKLVIVVDVEPMTDTARPRNTIDLPNFARRILAASADQYSVELVSASWDGPGSFMRPADHDARIKQMERRAQWSLGRSAWAAKLFTAYEFPAEDQRVLEVEQAD